MVMAIPIDTKHTTSAPSLSSHPPLQPGPPVEQRSHSHGPSHRFFIGPLPSEASAQVRESRRILRSILHAKSSGNDTESLSSLSDERLWKFIKQSRGRPDNWDDNINPGLRDELVRKLKNSPWAGLAQSGKKTGRTKWIGDSFEVGVDLLGENTIVEEPKSPTSASRFSISSKPPLSVIIPQSASVDPSAPASSYHTAVEGRTPFSASIPDIRIESDMYDDRMDSRPLSGHLPLEESMYRTSSDVGSHAKSDTELLPDHPSSQEAGPSSQSYMPGTTKNGDAHKHLTSIPKVQAVRSALRRALPSTATSPHVAMPRIAKPDRQVSFASQGDALHVPNGRVGTRSADAGPANPSEVLARTNDEGELGHTSAGAVILSTGDRRHHGHVVLRDRMLVKISYTRAGSLPTPYDEDESLRHPDVAHQSWGEYSVLWTGRRIEIYESYSLPGKEWLFGHKKLAFLIPLDRSTTHLASFSFVDGSFCLTCPPVTTDGRPEKSHLRRSTIGTNVFIFKCKTRSRGIDWLWLLWRELGAGDTLPSTLDIQIPVLGTRITLNIPRYDALDGGEGYKSLTRAKILDICQKQLKRVEEYRDVMKKEIDDKGGELGLAWSRKGRLDWVWLDQESSTDGNMREWDILWGLAMKQGHIPVQLELRLVTHSPQSKVKLLFTPPSRSTSNGDRNGNPDASVSKSRASSTALTEPPSVEGFLYRIKPNSQARSTTYLSTHGGNLFTCTSSHAYPPSPPTLSPPVFPPPSHSGHQHGENSEGIIPIDGTDIRFRPRTTRAEENHRGAKQIMHATGYIDLRNIVNVRKGKDTMAPKLNVSEEEIQAEEAEWQDLDRNGTGAQEEEEEQGEADLGGDETLAGRADGGMEVKRRRSFELVMRTGVVVRFEAHSVPNALEWISRLRKLIKYWTHRHRLDARLEMDLVTQISDSPLPYNHLHHGRRASTIDHDPREVSQSLSSFWNWCVLDGCMPILKAGKLFKKPHPRKLFKHMYLVLIPGHLVFFHLTATKFGHHHRSKTFNLTDAYVYSGVLASQHELSRKHDDSTKQNASGYPGAVPRRYQDGLETMDSNMDTTFVVRYVHNPSGWDELKVQGENGTEEKMWRPKVAGVPNLDGRHGLLIMKTRSKLERDAWCWALNCEIERLARTDLERERILRDF